VCWSVVDPSCLDDAVAKWVSFSNTHPPHIKAIVKATRMLLLAVGPPLFVVR
jgi:hypothetical protein